MSHYRVAIIADIHGNYHALEAVLKDIEQQAVDEIIVNGDHVNRNPDNIRVMETLKHSDVRLLQGNHDALMHLWADRDASLPQQWFADPFWNGVRWVVQQLEQANWLDFLRDLPFQHHLQLPNAPSVLITHGSPRHYREGYSRWMDETIISEIVQMHPADIYVGSHTHRPFQHSWGKHRVLNTGAVGTPFNGDPRAQYLILSLRDDGWHSEFRAIPYDRQATLALFDSSGFAEFATTATQIFREELQLALGLYGRFFEITAKEDLERNSANYEMIKARYPERIGTGWTEMKPEIGVPPIDRLEPRS